MPIPDASLKFVKTYIWTVVRVVQHSHPVAEKSTLNLESDDSGSASSHEPGDRDPSDERSTLEMSDIVTQARDPVPDGYTRKANVYPRSNPKLTLVFLAYDRGMRNSKQQSTLINVSHLVHKFATSQMKM